MMASLKETIEKNNPEYTKSVIKHGLHTDKGKKCVWIVVEDHDDIKVYERFFDNVTILPSENEDGLKGAAYVESIVSEIIDEENYKLIFGIRDADYTRYEGVKHCFHAAIFVTDCRDIEMMMLSSPSVNEALAQWNKNIPELLSNGEPVLRKLGYMRICNHIKSLGCNFKKKVKISKIWDECSHALCPDWEEKLMGLFLSNCANCKEIFTEKDFESIVKSYGLESESKYNICQGHDTIKLLQYMLIHTQTFNERSIMSKMTESYSFDDFKNTELYKSILLWSKSNKIKVLRS